MADDNLATGETTSFSELPTEFLTPEQRLDAIAEILSAIILRVIKKRMTKTLKSKDHNSIPSRKRIALYARVSTQEQTKGQFPSYDSQIEELESFAASKGWKIVEAIKDEGHRAGTLQRPGLTLLRHLVTTGQVEVVACTWYNRLIGSRDFYVLDKEFKANKVQFITIHDPTDRNTASGHLLESMLVTIKTFENEQIAEKVQTKLRQRAEKGLWNGGRVPFAFNRDFERKTIIPDKEKGKVVEQMLRVYVESRSDFKVRDWLKARHIPSPTGNPSWAVGAIRGVLTNHVYIGKIQVNHRNKNKSGVPELESYRLVDATFEPLVPKELFELAQSIRGEEGEISINRIGKPRNYGHNRCRRVYLLQGALVCGVCGRSMTPHYTYHKPGKGRENECYIHYYVCASQIRKLQEHPHKNRVSAKIAEGWMMDTVRELIETKGLLEKCFESAWQNYQQQSQPQQDAFAINSTALHENQNKSIIWLRRSVAEKQLTRSLKFSTRKPRN
jgi:site-specific DNA recombinase